MTGLAAGGGLGLLIALASYIGLAADRDARDSAWRRIALTRRVNNEEGRRLRQREFALDELARDLDARESRLAHREQSLVGRERRGSGLAAVPRSVPSVRAGPPRRVRSRPGRRPAGATPPRGTT